MKLINPFKEVNRAKEDNPYAESERLITEDEKKKLTFPKYERKNFIVRDEKVGIKVKKKLPFRYSPHKDIFEINGPTFGTTSPAFYVPHPRPKRTPKEIEESKLRRMEKNRINVKNWYTRHGLHLGKVGRPKNPMMNRIVKL